MNKHAPRHPIMAAIMSLVLPGFGQLYNGEWNKGILIFIGFILCGLPLPVLAALYLPSAWMLWLLVVHLLLVLGIWLYGIVDAFRSARIRQPYTLKPWQQPACYIGVFLLAMLLILPGMTTFIKERLVESFHIPSSSMEPSILRGDLLFADKRYNCPGCKHHARRGDIAIFVYPNNRSRYYIKRIIGLPGDRVRVAEQTVFVNGAAVTQMTESQEQQAIVTEKLEDTSYQVAWKQGDANEFAEFTVPDGEVFVLGDNRSASRDSRDFGTVPLMDVVGKVRQVWFSFGDDGVRWERLGLVVD